MGKIRVKTLGDETQEKEEKKVALRKAQGKQQRKEAKAAGKKSSTEESVIASETKQSFDSVKQSQTDEIATSQVPRDDKTEKDTKKAKKKFDKNKKVRSDRYSSLKTQVEVKKVYPLSEALDLLAVLQTTKFDETVELHINTLEGISGNLTLPHGTGKKVRVMIANASKDPKALDELIKTVESGKIEFDVLVATPDSMPKLARVAKFLGPRGLMPNPKAGTVTAKPEDVAEKFAGGQMNYKTEAKAPILHMVVGKVSFGKDKLTDNIKTVFATLPSAKLLNVTLKSTMSPGIKISFA